MLFQFTQAQVVSALYDVLQAVLIATIPFLVKLGWDYFQAQAAKLREQANGEAHDASAQFIYHLMQVATLYVKAAEKMWFGTPGAGAAKRKWVIDAIQAYFDAKHIQLDATLLESTVEAAVQDQFPKGLPQDVAQAAPQTVPLTPALASAIVPLSLNLGAAS